MQFESAESPSDTGYRRFRYRSSPFPNLSVPSDQQPLPTVHNPATDLPCPNNLLTCLPLPISNSTLYYSSAYQLCLRSIPGCNELEHCLDSTTIIWLRLLVIQALSTVRSHSSSNMDQPWPFFTSTVIPLQFYLPTMCWISLIEFQLSPLVSHTAN